MYLASVRLMSILTRLLIVFNLFFNIYNLFPLIEYLFTEWSNRTKCEYSQ